VLPICVDLHGVGKTGSVGQTKTLDDSAAFSSANIQAMNNDTFIWSM
jgi:hypothetical protein